MKALSALVIIALVVLAVVWTVQGAIDCGNKGGRYIPGRDGQMPICVKEVK